MQHNQIEIRIRNLSKIVEFVESNPGKSAANISEELKIDHRKVGGLLIELKRQGKVHVKMVAGYYEGRYKNKKIKGYFPGGIAIDAKGSENRPFVMRPLSECVKSFDGKIPFHEQPKEIDSIFWNEDSE